MVYHYLCRIMHPPPAVTKLFNCIYPHGEFPTIIHINWPVKCYQVMLYQPTRLYQLTTTLLAFTFGAFALTQQCNAKTLPTAVNINIIIAIIQLYFDISAQIVCLVAFPHSSFRHNNQYVLSDPTWQAWSDPRWKLGSDPL